MLPEYSEALLRLFYPAECEICRKMLTLEEDILCTDCTQNLHTLAWPLEKALIEDRFESLNHVWAVFAYQSPLRELLHSIKYGRRNYLFKPCRRPSLVLAQALTANHWYDAILPVPIHGLKLVERHFNQAEVLAEMLSPWLTLPVCKSLLIKKHSTPSQTSLNRKEREMNVYGAFQIHHPQKIYGRSFLLMDDVFTTGATANEAARVLKLHGARRVDLFALACTVNQEDKNSLRLAAPEAMILAS